MMASAALEKSPGFKPGHEAADLVQITAILKRALSGRSCTAYLFGSRATGAAQPASDFDVAVFAPEDISRELRLPFSIIVRDAAIQRFAYSFESAWKLLKGYLETHEGLICNSPKGCFREALQTGLLSREEVETCLIMTDDRNLTAHTYLESLAERIYAQLPAYLTVMQSLARQVTMRIEKANDAQEDQTSTDN